MRHAQVDEDRAPGPGDEDVRGFHVPVHESVAVQGVQRVADVDGQTQRRGQRQRRGARGDGVTAASGAAGGGRGVQQVGQRRPVVGVHDEGEATLDLLDGVHAGEPGVVHAGQQGGLAAQRPVGLDLVERGQGDVPLAFDRVLAPAGFADVGPRRQVHHRARAASQFPQDGPGPEGIRGMVGPGAGAGPGTWGAGPVASRPAGRIELVSPMSSRHLISDRERPSH